MKFPTVFALLLLGFPITSLPAADEDATLPPTKAEVSYDPHEMNVLDFWKAKGEGPRPLLIHIHGGGWVGGDKKQTPAKVNAFLDKGISKSEKYANANEFLFGVLLN